MRASGACLLPRLLTLIHDIAVCHAFPDDAYVTDQIFVGLICVAVSLPVTLFLEKAFEIANEVDGAAGGWRWYDGMRRMLLGRHAHADWHWKEPGEGRRKPSELVLWLTQNDDPNWIEALMFLARWVPMQLLDFLLRCVCLRKDSDDDDKSEGDDGKDDVSSSGSAKARAAALSSRLHSVAGLLGVFMTWAIFSWVRVRASLHTSCPL